MPPAKSKLKIAQKQQYWIEAMRMEGHHSLTIDHNEATVVNFKPYKSIVGGARRPEAMVGSSVETLRINDKDVTNRDNFQGPTMN